MKNKKDYIIPQAEYGWIEFLNERGINKKINKLTSDYNIYGEVWNGLYEQLEHIYSVPLSTTNNIKII
jgi:hypothetical protein